MTLSKLGIEWAREFTTVLIPRKKINQKIMGEKNLPSFLDTTLRGLSALKARNPLTKPMSRPSNMLRINVTTEKNTIMKSRTFQLSLRYVISPK